MRVRRGWWGALSAHPPRLGRRVHPEVPRKPARAGDPGRQNVQEGPFLSPWRHLRPGWGSLLMIPGLVPGRRQGRTHRLDCKYFRTRIARGQHSGLDILDTPIGGPNPALGIASGLPAQGPLPIKSAGERNRRDLRAIGAPFFRDPGPVRATSTRSNNRLQDYPACAAKGRLPANPGFYKSVPLSVSIPTD
jgi:hypothetical protein